MKQSVKLIVGNWKMNGLSADMVEAVALNDALNRAEDLPLTTVRVGLCPPATLIERLARTLSGGIVAVGGQDCRAEACGAFTGSISAAMLVDAGASLVIVGHSERRAEFGETDALVKEKASAALTAGLEPIVCVGETLTHRQQGQAVAIVQAQIKGSVPRLASGQALAVAYEPVWAIGTGLTPTLDQIDAVHHAIRSALVEQLGSAGNTVPILYGGSVKPDNAADILALSEVGGTLVGGASLKAEDFLAIIRAAERPVSTPVPIP